MNPFISTTILLLAVICAPVAQHPAGIEGDAAISRSARRNDARPRTWINAGYSVARITGQSPSYKPFKAAGFTLAPCSSPRSRSGVGYRSGLLFSRQVFSFKESGKRASITNDYTCPPQLTTLGITRFFQLQVGGQVGYFLRSGKKTATPAGLMTSSFASRMGYGGTSGAELSPFTGIVPSGRFAFSLGDAYQEGLVHPGQTPSSFPNLCLSTRRKSTGQTQS